MNERKFEAVSLLSLLLLGILLPHIQVIAPAWASSGNTLGNNQTGAYIDPSFTQAGTTYTYTTSFGIYTISYVSALKLYSVAFKNGDTIVSMSGLAVLENSSGSWLPINVQPNPNPFTIGAPSFITPPTGERFAVTQTLDYKKGSVKATLGELTLIISFSKSAYPKISVALNEASYQVDPTCVNTLPHECAIDTYWNKVGLKDMQWIWAIAPVSGYDKYQSATLGEVTVTTVSSILTSAKAVNANFKGLKNWFADWSSVGSSNVAVEPATVSILGQSVLIVRFTVNMTGIDPTFGLTSTGSTSYPTAKAITANGGAQIDTAQSAFGGASGLFDGTGDYLSLADSADWYFGTGDFTIDFWVRFAALPATTKEFDFCGQYVDSTHNWMLYIYNSAGTYYLGYWRGSGSIDIYAAMSSTPVVNTWYHIALVLVRSTDTWTWYQNGTGLTPVVNTATHPDIASTLRIGTYTASTNFLNGWLDEFRVSNIARWTSNFTPPTARYDRDSTTVLLLHMDGADASTTFLDDVTTGTAKATWWRLTDNNAAVSSVSFYTHTAGNYRVAIWNDTGATAPHKLLWESGDTAASATTWNNVTISAGTPTSLTLQSGKIWLAWQWNPGAAYVAGPSYTAGSANNGTYLYQAYGAFPASWSGTASVEKWSIFATYSTGQTLSAALSASGSGSESVIRALVVSQSGSSSGSGSESATVQKVLARSFSDAGSGLASILAAVTGYRANSDSGAGQESLTRLFTSNQAPSSSGSGSESISTLKTIQRVLSDLGSGLDAIAKLFGISRTSTESGSGLETLSTSQVLQRIVSDTGSGLDSLIRQIVFGRTGTDTGSGTETVTSQAGLSRTLTDLGVGLDSLAQLLSHSPSLTDQGTGIETLSRLFTSNRVATDVGAGLESLIRQLILGRIGTETGAGAESVSAQQVLQRITSETGTGLESLLRQITFGRGPSDVGAGSESTSITQTIDRLLSELGSGIESVLRQIMFTRTNSESGSGSETVSTQSILQKLLAESGTGIEIVNVQIVFGRTVTDLGSGIETPSRLFAASRNIFDFGSGLDSLTRILGQNVIIVDQGTGTETLARIFSISRNPYDSGGGTDVLVRMLSASRSIFDFGSAFETLTHILTVFGPPLPPSGGGGGGVIIHPLPTTVMVGAVFPRPIWFLLPGARISQDITVTNPTDTPRIVTVHYTVTDIATGQIVYEDTLHPTVDKGSSTYTVISIITATGRYRIDITAVDGGTATAEQEFTAGIWDVWQGPILLWVIIAFAAAVLILVYKRIQDEW